MVVLALVLAAGTITLFTDRPLEALGALAQRVRNRLARHREPLTNLPRLLIDERDVIRSILGRRWWEALLYAAGNVPLDYAALLAALAAVGARPRASLVLLAYVMAQLLGMVPLTPGGLGFVEVGLAATLGLAGVGAAQATLRPWPIASWPSGCPSRRAAWLMHSTATVRPPGRAPWVGPETPLWPPVAVRAERPQACSEDRNVSVAQSLIGERRSPEAGHQPNSGNCSLCIEHRLADLAAAPGQLDPRLAAQTDEGARDRTPPSDCLRDLGVGVRWGPRPDNRLDLKPECADLHALAPTVAVRRLPAPRRAVTRRRPASWDGTQQTG